MNIVSDKITKYRNTLHIDKKNEWKLCNKCKNISDLNNFRFEKTKDLYCTMCKNCEKIKTQNYRTNNREKVRANGRRYLKEIRNEPNHKERIRNEKKRYYQKHKEQLRIKSRNYYQSNKIRIAKRANIYTKNRRKNDIMFKFVENLRNSVRRAIKCQFKSEKTMDLLGCTINEFLNHLESQFDTNMSWNNYGKKINQWSIDHILCCELFDFSNPKHQKFCFNYKNIKPLCHIDNESKSDLLPDGRRARNLSLQEKKEYLIYLGYKDLFDI